MVPPMKEPHQADAYFSSVIKSKWSTLSMHVYHEETCLIALIYLQVDLLQLSDKMWARIQQCKDCYMAKANINIMLNFLCCCLLLWYNSASAFADKVTTTRWSNNRHNSVVHHRSCEWQSGMTTGFITVYSDILACSSSHVSTLKK